MRAIDRKISEYKPGAEHWLTVAEICKAIGVGRSRLKSIREAIGNSAEHKTGENASDPVYFYGPVWLLQWAEYSTRPERINGRAGPVADDDARRLTKAKADKAELELEMLRGTVTRVEHIKAGLEAGAKALREAAENMCPSCQQMHSSACDESARLISDFFANES